MNKLISSILATALSVSACAQMPTALIDSRAIAIPSSVDKLTLIASAGDFLAVMPRNASDPCPAFARFRFVTADVISAQSAAIVSTFASVQANKTESMAVEVRSVCSTDTCLLLPPGQAMGSSDTTTKINREIEALQGQVSKAWDATVGKLAQQQASSTECDKTSQTCRTQAGTVGESIKTQKLN